MKETIIRVNGMVCEGCENRVKNSLSTVDGIESVEANHKTGIVKVMLKDANLQSIIEEKIEDIGFEVIKE